MQLLARERQEGREQDLEAVDAGERRVQHSRRTCAVGLDRGPRRLIGDVSVRKRRCAHCFAERGFEPGLLDQLPDGTERCLDAFENATVRICECAGWRHFAKVAVDVRKRSVDEVAPICEQLVVVAPHELLPRKRRSLRLRPGCREVIANSIGIEALEDVPDVDPDAATRRHLLLAEHQELARDHVVRGVEFALTRPVIAALAVADEHARPDGRVEDDVVLAHEVRMRRVGVLPPLAPRFRSFTSASAKFRTFDRQLVFDSIHGRNLSAKAGRLRKRCVVSRNSGVVPSITECGLIRSDGSSWFPQLSHWSPRACVYPQIGHVPSMYRSGSVLPVVAEKAPIVFCSISQPCSYSVRKKSCVTRAWFGVVVRVKQSYEIPRSRRSSRIWRLYWSASSRGETPSRSADTITGVPCSSVPVTISTSFPFSRW